MTALLIDGVGRRRLCEVPMLVREIRVPVYESVVADVREDAPIRRGLSRIATFRLADEPSWPPVYRWAGVSEL
jgi:hypothetical protein